MSSAAITTRSRGQSLRRASCRRGPPFVSTRSWRSFGIELRSISTGPPFLIPAAPCRLGKGDGWVNPPHPTQSEFRSPPFFGDTGLTQMVRDIWAIKRAGWGGISRTCGCHLHIDMSGADTEDYRAIFRSRSLSRTRSLAGGAFAAR